MIGVSEALPNRKHLTRELDVCVWLGEGRGGQQWGGARREIAPSSVQCILGPWLHHIASVCFGYYLSQRIRILYDWVPVWGRLTCFTTWGEIPFWVVCFVQVALSCIFGDVACIVISTVVRPLLVMLRVLCELRALSELHWWCCVCHMSCVHCASCIG